MSPNKNHIVVCICTYKRPELLTRCLKDVLRQETEGLFEYSVLISDNDKQRSAEAFAVDLARTSAVRIQYCVAEQQGISHARNKAVENASGDFIAFIDDDEFPTERWLLTLFKACHSYGVDGALGPVKPHFDTEPPKWVIKGGFYDRPSYPTGTIIDWKKGRTGNTFLKKEVFAGINVPFNPEFRSGEDQDLFRRLIAAGYRFVWCHEALAYEVVPAMRWDRWFMLRRALLRGSASTVHANFGWREIAKSIVAVAVYTVALPFAFLAGHFMTLCVKLFDHAGKLLAAAGINPIKEPYVTG
jgi:succinoglycan biosynthesis protein ExoM